MTCTVRITKRQWYNLGGFARNDLWRKHNGRHYEYYQEIRSD